MKGDKAKWVYTFVIIGVSCWWFSSGHGMDNAFSGALISILTLTVQYWFRKKAPNNDEGGK